MQTLNRMIEVVLVLAIFAGILFTALRTSDPTAHMVGLVGLAVLVGAASRPGEARPAPRVQPEAAPVEHDSDQPRPGRSYL